MTRIVVAFLVTLVALSAPAYSQKPVSSARGLVESGMDAYRNSDASAAIKAWVKGSAMEGNTQALSQANVLRQIEDFYGKPTGIDIIKEVSLGPRTKMLYFAINYEKGVAFGNFQAYLTSSGEWIATQFKFHTDATQVLHSSLLNE